MFCTLENPEEEHEEKKLTLRVSSSKVNRIARLDRVAVLDLLVRLVEREVVDARVEVLLAEKLVDGDVDDVGVRDVVPESATNLRLRGLTLLVEEKTTHLVSAKERRRASMRAWR